MLIGQGSLRKGLPSKWQYHQIDVYTSPKVLLWIWSKLENEILRSLTRKIYHLSIF